MSHIFHWGLRLSVVAGVLIILGLPKPPPPKPEPLNENIVLGPQKTVETNDPRLCVHTRLTDEVEEAKIQQTFELVREMGATTVVEFLPWAYVENEEGNFSWKHPDRIIKHAENQGITLIARLGFVPDWARENVNAPTTLNYLPESSYPDFANYIEAFAKRYAGRVDHIIIWNEQNLNFEWGGRPADPVSYTELLSQAYEAAHRGNPDVMVMNGALAPTTAPPGGATGGWDDLDYLRIMYENGAGNYFDALAVHTYGLGEPPLAEPGLNFRRIELIREIMVEFGDEDKRVYLTETGWNDHPRWAYATNPSQRINYTIEMFNYSDENYPWLDALCIWVFRYPAPTNSYPDYYTLVTPDFVLKPIYEALQDYALE